MNTPTEEDQWKTTLCGDDAIGRYSSTIHAIASAMAIYVSNLIRAKRPLGSDLDLVIMSAANRGPARTATLGEATVEWQPEGNRIVVTTRKSIEIHSARTEPMVPVASAT